jgi:GAF domain-containing protein
VANLSLTQDLDLDVICEKLLDYLSQLVPYDSATIFLLQNESRLLTYAVRGYERWHGPPPDFLEVQANVQMAAVVSTKAGLMVPDTAACSTWQNLPGTAHVASWLGVPMLLSGKVIGLCSLDSTRADFFTADQMRLVEVLAVQAAVAIENARLYASAQQELAERKRAEAAKRVVWPKQLTRPRAHFWPP